MSNSKRLILALALPLAASYPLTMLRAMPPADARTFEVAVHGAGQPVILIPGLSTPGQVWDETVAHLEDRFQLHVLTLAGFGGPAPVGAPFLPRVATEIAAYIRDQGLEKPVLIGHSLGGFLAFQVAAAEAALIGGVVAVDGVPFLSALADPSVTAESQRAQAEQIAAMYTTMPPEQLAAQTRLTLAGMITDPENVERAAAWSAGSDPASVGLAVAELMTTDLRQKVSKITAPVLLIGALGAAPEGMRPVFRESYRAQVAAIPDVEVIFAESARHFMMLDDPDFLFAALDGFLMPPVETGGNAWTRN